MTKKHALLLFSKPPVPGMVKTRLTQEHGGPFTPGEAAEFFTRSMYDVAENGMQAMTLLERESQEAHAQDPDAEVHTYDFFVSTTPEDSLELMKAKFDEIGPWPYEIHYITDKGATFDEHFDDAFQQIFDQGYESIVSIGGDIPIMPQSHILQAFQWLHYFAKNSENGGFVQAPCQECGVSLVGFTRNTPMNHQEVYYNMTGRPALDAYVQKAEAKNVPFMSLPPVADVDTGGDLAHTISILKSIRYSKETCQSDLYLAQRTLDWIEWRGFTANTPPNENHDPRDYIDV